MRVIAIQPRGYCHGVVAAVAAVNRCLDDPTIPRPIYILGMIVHNRFVVERFTARGAITLDEPGKTRRELLDRISSGTVIVTAHGVSADVFTQIRSKGLFLVDATCQDVLKTHAEIQRHRQAGYDIFFIGKAGHPETEAVLASGGVRLIEDIASAMALPQSDAKVFVANQTTFGIRDILPIISAIRDKYPQAVIGDEICAATRKRQEAVLAAAKEADFLIVVGDPHSNNTANLARIGRESAGLPTKMIESVDDLDPSWFTGVACVAVTAGASTPTDVTVAVIDRLQNFQPAKTSDPEKR
ncbi:MAG: 4-hydroxy-3-methylbut-2-enyl diphosphate reductase [bacterium]